MDQRGDEKKCAVKVCGGGCCLGWSIFFIILGTSAARQGHGFFACDRGEVRERPAAGGLHRERQEDGAARALYTDHLAIHEAIGPIGMMFSAERCRHEIRNAIQAVERVPRGSLAADYAGEREGICRAAT